MAGDSSDGRRPGPAAPRQDKDKDKGTERKDRPRDQGIDMNRYQIKSPANKQSTQVMLKAILQLMQRTRDIESVVIHTFLLPTSSAIATSMKDEQISYETQVRKHGRGHSLGPPHLHLWARLMETLALLSSTAPADQRDLAAENDTINHMENPQQLDEQVHLLRLTKTYKLETKRLLLASHHTITPAVIRALQAAGAQRKSGRAPRGALEDELERWLTNTFS